MCELLLILRRPSHIFKIANGETYPGLYHSIDPHPIVIGRDELWIKVLVGILVTLDVVNSAANMAWYVEQVLVRYVSGSNVFSS